MNTHDPDPRDPGKAAKDPVATSHGGTESGACWFCDKGPSEGALAVDMYLPVRLRGRSRSRARVEFTIDTIAVPRCEKCRSAHARAKWCTLGFTVLGVLAGLGAFTFVATSEAHGNRLGAVIGIGFAFMGFGAGDRIGRGLFARGIKPESAKVDHPMIRTRLAEGWRIGRRPGTPLATARASALSQSSKMKRRKRTRKANGKTDMRPEAPENAEGAPDTGPEAEGR